MSGKYICCLFILFFATYSSVLSQTKSDNQIIDYIVKDKKVKKYLTKETNKSWKKENSTFFIEPKLKCITKLDILAFYNFIQKNEKQIGVSIVDLIRMHSDVCDSAFLTDSVMKKSMHFKSNICFVLSAEVNNTLICYIYSNRNDNETNKKERIQQSVYQTPMKIMLLLNDEGVIIKKEVIPSGIITSPVRFIDG